MRGFAGEMDIEWRIVAHDGRCTQSCCEIGMRRIGKDDGRLNRQRQDATVVHRYMYCVPAQCGKVKCGSDYVTLPSVRWGLGSARATSLQTSQSRAAFTYPLSTTTQHQLPNFITAHLDASALDSQRRRRHLDTNLESPSPPALYLSDTG